MYFIELGLLDIANPCKHLHKIENIDIEIFQGKMSSLLVCLVYSVLQVSFWSEGRRFQGVSKSGQYVCTVLYHFLNNH